MHGSGSKVKQSNPQRGSGAGGGSPNWASQASSVLRIASLKARRQFVRWPGRQRSTVKWPRDFPLACTLLLCSS